MVLNMTNHKNDNFVKKKYLINILNGRIIENIIKLYFYYWVKKFDFFTTTIGSRRSEQTL